MPDHRDLAAGVPPSLVAPASASLRGSAPAVRDQGGIGSCVANSVVEAAGFLYLRAGRPDVQLSRLFLYATARERAGVPLTEDSGCQIRDAIKAFAASGACLESTMPYDEGAFSAPPTSAARAEALDHKALFYYRCAGRRTLCASIAQGFPVVFGFSVPENMLSAECSQTGVVSYPAATEGFEGGHAVLAVGYDDASRLVCFQNSWGAGWGDGGFGYLPYKFFDDSLVDDCWTLRKETF